MQMVIGLVVLVLIAVGIWWYMGNGTPSNTTPTTDTTTMEAGADVKAEI